MITIELNGRHHQLMDTNLSAVLSELGYRQGFAIAINQIFIPRCDYDKTVLSDGDQIEIVAPMQGG